MKILLNCLPPTDENCPSIALSILKKFMNSNGVETSVKYWNFTLSVMSDYTNSEETEIKILPFLSMLNDKHKNERGNNRILALLQQLNPPGKAESPNFYSEFLIEKKTEVIDAIYNEFDKINLNEISLFGISAKYNQWIPGIILAEEIKKVAPHIKIVVGGFGSKEAAQEALRLCPIFDFTTWGEGEYPLLELWNQLQDNKTDFSVVPRLFYKEVEQLKQSKTQAKKYLDFENYIYPDYDDFFDHHPNLEYNDQISIPINTIRSCHWSKCKFCDFNKGYKLRMRTPKCIVAEIHFLFEEYGITTFTFVDSDTFGNLEHFNELLNLLIEIKYNTEEDFIYWAEIIPNNQFNNDLMNKMAIAGFKNLFIGYDALADALLNKMSKSNTFSDNIFFVKASLKNGINPLVNVIKHVPGETENDVQECMNNLHFLRFFYNNSIVNFHHTYASLVLSSMTKYYSLLSKNEKEAYNTDDYSYLLPDFFADSPNRFHLFRYSKDVPSNIREWNKLIEVEDYYKTNTFQYKVHEANGVFYYTEYCNETEVANITFSEPIYAFVLKTCNSRVWEFSELMEIIMYSFPQIVENQLINVLSNLKSDCLLYCNSDYTNIVSLIEL